MHYFGQPKLLTGKEAALSLFVTEAGNCPPAGTNQTSTRRIWPAGEVPPGTEDWQKLDSNGTPNCSSPGALTCTCAWGIERQTPVPAVITAAAVTTRFYARSATFSPIDIFPTNTTERDESP